jgi:hypothetical protein
MRKVAAWALKLGTGRSVVGTEGIELSVLGIKVGDVRGPTYWDGVDVKDGDLRGEVGQVSAGTGFVECTFDEVREIRRGLYARHVGVRVRHRSIALSSRRVDGWRSSRLLGIASMKSWLVRARRSYTTEEQLPELQI